MLELLLNDKADYRKVLVFAATKKLADQLSLLHSPMALDRRAQELKLGLAPAQHDAIAGRTAAGLLELEE